MAGKLNKLRGLSWGDRLLLAEAAASLAAARLAVLALPFRWIAPRLGRTMAASPVDDPADRELPRRVGWALGVASRHLPWPSRCLAEAIAGKAMLQRRAVSSTLYIGLARGDQASLESHAWLRCGSRVVVGERASQGFEVIASFAEPQPAEPARRPQEPAAKASRSKPSSANSRRVSGSGSPTTFE